MGKRLTIKELEPAVYNTLIKQEQLLQNSDIDPIHYELIKLRASQINGCAYCLDMHTKDALDLGETPRRIAMLNAWKETTIYTKEEKVILEMTEEITLIHKNGLTDSTFKKAKALFDENYIALVIMSIVQINSWNRIAISSKEIVS